jgi:arylsulfatase A-like enzyme
MSPVGDFGETEWRQYLWAYYRMIESVDRYMEAFLDHPEVRALLDHTLIVFLSDHGDCQGAQLWNQKTVLLDESSRVPLLFHQPGRIEPGVSRTLAQTGIDLFPTLCNLAGLEIPADLPGSPLLDTEGRPCDPGRPCVVSVCSMVQGAEIDGVKPELEGRMVRSDRYKYCQYDRGSLRESLVDMEDDPGETRNLAPDPAFRKVVHEHRNLLADHCRVTGDPFLALFNREAERQG